MTSPFDLDRASSSVFLLWGDYFDETVAAIFVSQLRHVGLRVKVIGLTGERSAGVHKLELCADMTLGEARSLRAKASCLIIPCSAATMRRFDHDPRLLQLLKQICTPHTHIIVPEEQTIGAAIMQELTISTNRIIIYNNEIDLITFAQQVAKLLSTSA